MMQATYSNQPPISSHFMGWQAAGQGSSKSKAPRIAVLACWGRAAAASLGGSGGTGTAMQRAFPRSRQV